MVLITETVVEGIKFKEFLLKTYILLFHSLTEEGKCLDVLFSIFALFSFDFRVFSLNKSNIIFVF